MANNSSQPLPQLRVALLHRYSARLINRDVVGWWSYSVPEFEWDHYTLKKDFYIKRSSFEQAYDLIVYEDGKLTGRIDKNADIPVAYVIADSTLSNEHYRVRCQQAALNADLLLVDWDNLKRFEHLGIPACRFSFATNDRFFYPREKTTDVGFFHHSTPERKKLNQHLAEFCKKRGYSYASGSRIGEDYARAIGSAKININLGRNPQTRSDRIFDIFLSESCLLCDKLPKVSGEPRQLNKHYLQFRTQDELEGLLDELLQEGTWQVFAEAAYKLGKKYHTWGRRARQLRKILWDLGL
jgi:hypothetical protein